MESADETTKRLEIDALKAGNHTHPGHDTDWFVSPTDCLCQWHFVNYFPMILNCLQGIVVSQTGHPEEPYLLSLVEIYSSTCSASKVGGKLLYVARSDIK